MYIMSNNFNKYLKYKNKYINLLNNMTHGVNNMRGGANNMKFYTTFIENNQILPYDIKQNILEFIEENDDISSQDLMININILLMGKNDESSSFDITKKLKRDLRYMRNISADIVTYSNQIIDETNPYLNSIIFNIIFYNYLIPNKQDELKRWILENPQYLTFNILPPMPQYSLSDNLAGLPLPPPPMFIADPVPMAPIAVAGQQRSSLFEAIRNRDLQTLRPQSPRQRVPSTHQSALQAAIEARMRRMQRPIPEAEEEEWNRKYYY